MSRVVQGVLTIVQAFNATERKDFVRALIKSGALTRDQQDILVIESRRGGPTRSLQSFTREMTRKGRLS